MKDYKVVKYKVTIHHKEIISENSPWENTPSYDTQDVRYCIVSTKTGEVLDNAQGFGYTSAQKAYSAYAYKIRDKSKDKEKLFKKKQINKWLNEHQSFVDALDQIAFEIWKGSWGPNAKVDVNLVAEILSDYKLETEFKASEILKAWKSRSI